MLFKHKKRFCKYRLNSAVLATLIDLLGFEWTRSRWNRRIAVPAPQFLMKAAKDISQMVRTH